MWRTTSASNWSLVLNSLAECFFHLPYSQASRQPMMPDRFLPVHLSQCTQAQMGLWYSRLPLLLRHTRLDLLNLTRTKPRHSPLVLRPRHTRGPTGLVKSLIGADVEGFRSRVVVVAVEVVGMAGVYVAAIVAGCCHSRPAAGTGKYGNRYGEGGGTVQVPVRLRLRSGLGFGVKVPQQLQHVLATKRPC